MTIYGITPFIGPFQTAYPSEVISGLERDQIGVMSLEMFSFIWFWYKRRVTMLTVITPLHRSLSPFHRWSLRLLLIRMLISTVSLYRTPSRIRFGMSFGTIWTLKRWLIRFMRWVLLHITIFTIFADIHSVSLPMSLQQGLFDKSFPAFSARIWLYHLIMDSFDMIPQRRWIDKRLFAKWAFLQFLLQMSPSMIFHFQSLCKSLFANWTLKSLRIMFPKLFVFR